MGQPQRLGNKQSKGHSRFKKFVGAAVALGGVALGIKADQEIKKQRRDQSEINQAELSNFLDPRNLPDIKPQGAGTDVIGTDAEGNIYGGAKVGTAGPGVKLGKPAPAPHQLPKPLDPSKLEPFGKKVKGAAGQAAIGQVAGVVAGKQTLGGAVKGIAGAVYGAAAQPKDPQQEFLAAKESGAKAGATIAIGAEGVKASNKELLGQLAGKGKHKVKKLLSFGG